MTAMTVTNSAILTGLVTDRVTDTNRRTYKVITVERTTGVHDLTLDLNTLTPCSGIVCALGEAYTAIAATSAQASTWSTTTITTVSGGAYSGAWLVYQ